MSSLSGNSQCDSTATGTCGALTAANRHAPPKRIGDASQNITRALMIAFMILSHSTFAFEHSLIVHDLKNHPDVGSAKGNDSGPERDRFQVNDSVETEASMTCSPVVNSDGGHNAGK